MAEPRAIPIDCSFRWKCPYSMCNEGFEFAWQRQEHLKSTHRKKTQEPLVDLAAGSGASASLALTAYDSVLTFEPAFASRPTTPIENKRLGKQGPSVHIDTPEEVGASSTLRESLRPPQKYNLFDSGNLIAVLGSKETGEVEVLVSSQAMCISSPVWRNLCSGQERVNFSDDDSDSILLLIHIAHMKFNEVPAQMDLHDLHCLAVVCEKYDTAMLLQPWARNWAVDLKSQLKEPFERPPLVISWVFGDAELFERAAKGLVFVSTCENGPGTLRAFYGGKVQDATSVVPHIIESVLKEREKAISSLFHMCDAYMWELSQTTNCQLCNGLLCNALNLGSLLQGLCKMGAWPEKPLEQYQRSKTLKDLQHSFLAIRFPKTPAQQGSYYSGECIGILNRDFVNKVNSICQSVSPVLPYHWGKLAERKKKLGLFP